MTVFSRIKKNMTQCLQNQYWKFYCLSGIFENNIYNIYTSYSLYFIFPTQFFYISFTTQFLYNFHGLF